MEILLVAAAGNEGGDAEGGAAGLTETHWKLTRVADHAVTVAEGRREPHLVFRAESGRAEGYGGCNQFGGNYTTEGSTIEIGDVVSTLMACAEGMDTERELFEALESARSWSIEGIQLELFDAAGERLASFEATPTD